jgi:hypothetical protein
VIKTVMICIGSRLRLIGSPPGVIIALTVAEEWNETQVKPFTVSETPRSAHILHHTRRSNALHAMDFTVGSSLQSLSVAHPQVTSSSCNYPP